MQSSILYKLCIDSRKITQMKCVQRARCCKFCVDVKSYSSNSWPEVRTELFSLFEGHGTAHQQIICACYVEWCHRWELLARTFIKIL